MNMYAGAGLACSQQVPLALRRHAQLDVHRRIVACAHELVSVDSHLRAKKTTQHMASHSNQQEPL